MGRVIFLHWIRNQLPGVNCAAPASLTGFRGIFLACRFRNAGAARRWSNCPRSHLCLCPRPLGRSFIFVPLFIFLPIVLVVVSEKRLFRFLVLVEMTPANAAVVTRYFGIEQVKYSPLCLGSPPRRCRR